MHPYPAFAEADAAKNLTFARDRGFGSLAMNGDDGPIVIHAPFLLSADGAFADLHLSRFNPVAQGAPGRAVMSVSGPDGYVSPDWYGVADQVPTWNYVAVHLRGVLSPLPLDTLSDLVDRQSTFFEQHLAPKPPWTADKMSKGVKDKMMKVIRPFRLKVETVQGIWKLNQNKGDGVRQSASERIGDGVGLDLGALAELMRDA